MDASDFIPYINKQKRSEPSQQDQSTMWFERYEPTTEAEIGVNKQKIKEVKKAIEQSAIFNNMIKLLILTGPTGCGKSALIKLLSRTYNFEITEWLTPFRSWSADIGHMDTFRLFLDQATAFNTLESVDQPKQGKIILMDDIPDLTTMAVQQQFYSVIQSCLGSSKRFLIVMIASTSYSNSENKIQNYARTIAPDSWKIDPRVEFIDFNPIGKSLINKALKNIILREKIRVANDKLDAIVENSNGDIRSAINSIQFTSRIPVRPIKKKKPNNDVVDFDNHIGNLTLFHAVGKVVYAKRNQDKTFESKPDHIINKIPISNDFFIDYIHQNCLGFFHDIDDVKNAFNDLAFADTLRYQDDYMDTIASYYRTHVSINGIMKNRNGTVSGSFKELAGTMFGKISYEKRKESYKDYEKEWMQSVALRLSHVVEEEDSQESDDELMIEKMFPDARRVPNTKKASKKKPVDVDEGEMYDEMFGDGTELADLDF